MKHNIYHRPIIFTNKRSKPLGGDIICHSISIYRTFILLMFHSLFGDRETVLNKQAGPVPDFCLNHTRIEQRWGATRARMIVVRQGGGRIDFHVFRLPYRFVKLLLALQTWPGISRYRVTQ